MTKNIKMVFESFTNDYFQNTDLDYNIFSTSVYDNLLKETYKSKINTQILNCNHYRSRL